MQRPQSHVIDILIETYVNLQFRTKFQHYIMVIFLQLGYWQKIRTINVNKTRRFIRFIKEYVAMYGDNKRGKIRS